MKKSLIIAFSMLLIASFGAHASDDLSTEQIATVKAEVTEVATAIINARDAETQLAIYAKDILSVSQGVLYPTYESLSEYLHAGFDYMKEINLSVWDDIQIDVITKEAAVLTGTFRYGSTNHAGESRVSHGVYSALFLKRNGIWQIKQRHESVKEN